MVGPVGDARGRWTRQELEEAFAAYQEVAAEAGRSGDWNRWAELFTDDAEYVEHLFGTMHGREAIRSWISSTMSTYPGNAMPEFPIGWSVIDEERGWIVCQVWNRMADPGDGSIHQAYNVTLLKYAGDGCWSYEEDIYNPAHFASMIEEWERRKAELEASEGR
ncbi:MAG: nuclear transport factor 2 family protein [Acidimicrobiia bacterium]|nr:nuclear transport factor 2 family protein [Acidimicrobiia bacterium]